MTDHRFGGRWTEQKLDCLRKYLERYRQIFSRNPRARYFKTWFVDAFAGTGFRIDSEVSGESILFEEVYRDQDSFGYRQGSAIIALSLSEPFDQYLFIEKSRGHLAKLKQTVSREYPALLPSCSFRHGDANRVLKQWCAECTWRERFYRSGKTKDLFGRIHETTERTATPDNIKVFIEERLRSCFEGVAKGLVLRNSRSSPLYVLCFAAANKHGAPTARKIAQYILDE